MMKYDFNIEHPLFFIKHTDATDDSPKYSAPLPYNWHETSDNQGWTGQYPIDSDTERQGWKVHVSSDLKNSHELLAITAEVCHDLGTAFKYLSTEKYFVQRNSKMEDRGSSGKFITCYPNQHTLEKFLNRLEDALSGFSGPYILNDKRWKKAPIYLRYGVFRAAKPGEEEEGLDIDELLISGQTIKDQRVPQFVLPDGLEIPDFLKDWVSDKGKNENRTEEFPFIIDSVNRFSNSGGIYRARLKSNNQKIILREVRPFTGLDFNGEYSSDFLNSEKKALNLLSDIEGVPKIYWSGQLWEHYFLGVEHMDGISLTSWTAVNYPSYKDFNGKKDYLKRAKKVIEELIDLIKNAHAKNVFHQDIHIDNIMVDEFDRVSVIDWELARFNNDYKVKQKAAALGFETWSEDYPSQIDWYGIKQVAHYLYLPLIEQSSLILGYAEHIRQDAHQLFTELSYPLEDIAAMENLLQYLDDKCTKNANLSEKKVVKPYKNNLPLNSDNVLQVAADKLIRGLLLAAREWRSNHFSSNHYFPVHYYGLDINQGLAFSDIAILWSCKKLSFLVKDSALEEYEKIKENIIQTAIAEFDSNNTFPGLFDGIVGSIWLIYELGEKKLASQLFSQYFTSLLDKSPTKTLYSGSAGILLVGLYFIAQKELTNDKMINEIFTKLDNFAQNYQQSPENFCKVGAGETQSNDPYENEAGLLYGHAGLGWLFGEAYRFTSNQKFKDCLNLAIETELKAYSADDMGHLQYQQGHRFLPYLATGSAGLKILISRNKEYLQDKILDTLPSLGEATNATFCVFPGLFNGFCGLELSSVLYHNSPDIIANQKRLLKNICKYFGVIEKGLFIAGDSGLKITTDVASGFGGIALTLASMQTNKLELLPNL